MLKKIQARYQAAADALHCLYPIEDLGLRPFTLFLLDILLVVTIVAAVVLLGVVFL